MAIAVLNLEMCINIELTKERHSDSIYYSSDLIAVTIIQRETLSLCYKSFGNLLIKYTNCYMFW